MKAGIHPELSLTLFRCSNCGAEHLLRAVFKAPSHILERCGECHMRTDSTITGGSRVDAFRRRAALAHR